MSETPAPMSVIERVEDDGSVAWEVICEGELVIFTYDRAVIADLERYEDEVRWVPA